MSHSLSVAHTRSDQLDSSQSPLSQTMPASSDELGDTASVASSVVNWLRSLVGSTSPESNDGGKSFFSFSNYVIGPLVFPFPDSFFNSNTWLPIQMHKGKEQVPSSQNTSILKQILLVLDYVRLSLDTVVLDRSGQLADLPVDLTFGHYLQQNGYSDMFIDEFFVPYVAAVCTCNMIEMKSYPAKIVLDFVSRMTNTGTR